MAYGGKLGFGLFGFAVAGPVGTILFAALGHLVDKSSEPKSSQDNELTQRGNILVAITILAAKLSKADGTVAPAEVETLHRYLELEQIGEDDMEYLAKIFNEAKKDCHDYEEIIDSINVSIDSMAGEADDEAWPVNMKLTLIDLLLRIAWADGSFTPPEEAFIQEVVDEFGVADEEYAALVKHYGAFAVLGCKTTDSLETVKQAFHAQLLKFHPDRVESKELPEEFILFATRKTEEITQAYELIRTHLERPQSAPGESSE